MKQIHWIKQAHSELFYLLCFTVYRLPSRLFYLSFFCGLPRKLLQPVIIRPYCGGITYTCQYYQDYWISKSQVVKRSSLFKLKVVSYLDERSLP